MGGGGGRLTSRLPFKSSWCSAAARQDERTRAFKAPRVPLAQESDGLSAGGSRLPGQIFNRGDAARTGYKPHLSPLPPLYDGPAPRSVLMHLRAVLQINAVAAGQKKEKKKGAVRASFFEANMEKLEFRKKIKPEGFSGSCLE